MNHTYIFNPLLALGLQKITSSVSGNVVEISSLADFPVADVNDEIHLPAGAYWIKAHVNLADKRLVCDGIVTIFGSSSESSSLTTTNSSAMIETSYTMPLMNISLTAPIAVQITGSSLDAYDFTAVNFINCPVSAIVNGCSNFIFNNGAALNSGELLFEGSCGTIAFNNTLFITANSATSIKISDTCTITRRFRVIYSSFVTLAGSTSLNVSALAIITPETYILDTVNFSGGGSYIVGVTTSSNKSLFTACKGINNTAVNGQLYMQNNAVATPIGVINTWYKVLGTTSASSDNNKYLHNNNRLTNDAAVLRSYLISCTLAFTSGNNNVCKFGFYDSALGTIRTPSINTTTANGAGRAENITLTCVVKHAQGDFLEVHCLNTSSTTAITVTDMNFVITEIN
jgi:hypothetical protein